MSLIKAVSGEYLRTTTKLFSISYAHPARKASTNPEPHKEGSTVKPEEGKDKKETTSGSSLQEKKYQPMAEQDAKIREALEGISGEGGEAGLELEDGQPTSMKKSVKNNMFRYI